jgi:deazaflavin-dependent oxidoreductase (nitroreductase family)
MSVADFKSALNDTDEIELTTTGRNSGRQSSRPVWFVTHGESLYLLPVTGSDSQWYKNVLGNPTIRLTAAGTEYTAQATLVTDASSVGEVVQRFQARYGEGDVDAYYPKRDVAIEVPLSGDV